MGGLQSSAVAELRSATDRGVSDNRTDLHCLNNNLKYDQNTDGTVITNTQNTLPLKISQDTRSGTGSEFGQPFMTGITPANTKIKTFGFSRHGGTEKYTENQSLAIFRKENDKFRFKSTTSPTTNPIPKNYEAQRNRTITMKLVTNNAAKSINFLNSATQHAETNNTSRTLEHWKSPASTGMGSSMGDELSFVPDDIVNSKTESTGWSSPSTQEGEVDKSFSASDGGVGFHAYDIPLSNVRNFSIIAHVDHGKSTLADRLLERTGAIDNTTVTDNNQVLDRLQVEKERGITVKAQTASLFYKHKDKDYLLNLIDTPGHVDFSNEVSRSLAACQGVILLVDASQGVQAQTVANFNLAIDKKLTVIPVLNKIDLPEAAPNEVIEQMFNLFDVDPDDVLMVSAAKGTGVDTLLEELVRRISPPPGDRSAPFRALIFDSWFDQYREAIAQVYVRDGEIKTGDEVMSAHSKRCFEVRELGLLRPHEQPSDKLVGGQVGYMVCNMQSTKEAHIGDTLVLKGSDAKALAGFKPAHPMVYTCLFPANQKEHGKLRVALDKLALNDPAVTIANDTRPVLGPGWRLGFLGLLHAEVFNQRLEQEFGAETILMHPSVPYKVKLIGANTENFERGYQLVTDPTKMPGKLAVEKIKEPIVLGTIITPHEYVSQIRKECEMRRGKEVSMVNLDSNRTIMKYKLPLNEIVVDFYDHIKSMTRGYASFDYKDYGYVHAKIVKLDVWLNNENVEVLSTLVHNDKAEFFAEKLCRKLATLLPRQPFQVTIKVQIKGKTIAEESLNALDEGGSRFRGGVQSALKKDGRGKRTVYKLGQIEIPKDFFVKFSKNTYY